MHSKNPFNKRNVKQCKDGNLAIPDHTALSGQRALIVVALLVSWCAIVFGANTAQAQSPPPYPKGIWGAVGVDDDLPPGLVNNLGIVGVGINEDWNVLNPAPGVYDWTQLDSKIAAVKAAGFQYIALAVPASSDKTPSATGFASRGSKNRSSTLQSSIRLFAVILTALYWNRFFIRHDRPDCRGRSAIPAIRPLLPIQPPANHHSNDWNIQDWVGTVEWLPATTSTFCGDVFVDQSSNGWMPVDGAADAQVGKEFCDAAAAAFPNQNIKLPIGGSNRQPPSTPDGDPADRNGATSP
jgi:hypothetical protein